MAGEGRRTSVVDTLRLDALAAASSLVVGDLERFDARSRALAVQRQVPVFLENEGDLRAFPLFSRPIPLPGPEPEERVRLTSANVSPCISAGNIRVLSAVASSLVQVGSVTRVELESRVKHIRQFVDQTSP